MALELYKLDQEAHDLVSKHSQHKDALNQTYKMRMTVVYGLERFWGEHLRLKGVKADYWKETWNKLAEIVSPAGIQLPTDSDRDIREIADELWSLPIEQRKVTLAVLTQLCECMVWWTQRYKPTRTGELTEEGE
ncbi:MAG: hypothetical protein RMY64_10445 [Nostoc sp. DedQUE08]|uniref:hypothetical protein n=1 Tax=Nostoc sp. DedQUE08 TaxID=3075393 RepID=UPI002AD425A4|nr:hypothetical protein [Nostoc sp. DedQUE08]MDZ8066044.1 hypothetical protein [Nostoc sp. DedQUE08]